MLNWKHLRRATIIVSVAMAWVMGWLTAGWLLEGAPWWVVAWSSIVALAWVGNAVLLHRKRPRT